MNGNELFVADQSARAIDVFPIDASGDFAPTRRILGAMTTMASTSGVYVSDTDIYVGDQTSNILVFDKNANGNNTVAPSRTIKISNAAGSLNTSLALTGYKNELYVSSAGNNTLYVIPPDSTGTVAPTRSMPSNYLSAAFGIGVFNGELFVTLANNSSIEAFDPQLSSAIPFRKVAGSTTSLNAPYGIVGFGKMLYAANYGNNTIQVFKLTDDGDVAPLATISGSMTKLSGSIGIAMIGVDE